MAIYKIYFKKSVAKDLAGLPKYDLRKVLKGIEELALNPRPAGCEKLTGDQRYRLRQGRYRILYTLDDNTLTIWVVKVAHRKAAYR